MLNPSFWSCCAALTGRSQLHSIIEGFHALWARKATSKCKKINNGAISETLKLLSLRLLVSLDLGAYLWVFLDASFAIFCATVRSGYAFFDFFRTHIFWYCAALLTGRNERGTIDEIFVLSERNLGYAGVRFALYRSLPSRIYVCRSFVSFFYDDSVRELLNRTVRWTFILKAPQGIIQH